MRRTSVAVLLASGESPPDGLDLVSPLADVHLVDDARTLAEALRRAEVIFVWDFRSGLLQTPWPDDRSVRWIHTGSIGIEVVLVDPVLEGDIVVTNTRGVFERPIAEYVLGLILMFAKDLRGTLAREQERRWEHRETETIDGARADSRRRWRRPRGGAALAGGRHGGSGSRPDGARRGLPPG
jgi:phosphoglycerate dehydrogenase-like enzyme